MQYLHAKRYPLIGAVTVIPVDALEYLNPVSGFEPVGATVITAVGDGATVVNTRNKLFVVATNTDAVNSITITVKIPGLIQGYAAEEVPVTIAAEASHLFGPFSANFENAGVVEFEFGGTSTDVEMTAGLLP